MSNLNHRNTAENSALIDLRSDTVTRPSVRMREAMASAEVGDDVYGEDPTINRLEQRAAEITGKEAALFVPTGSMGNTIGIKIHTNHGEEVLCDSRAHVLDWELSMMAWFAGCLARAVPSTDGILDWDHIQPALRGHGPHNAPTTLITLENTHNMAGGTVYPLDTIDTICDQAHQRDIKVHIDGARIFNASAASGVPVSRIVRHADSVMFCLSKGLGAPVGSMLAASTENIARGRLYRKRLGGGMRQAGVLAAAGLIALEDSPARLHQDHANAKFLAERLSEIPGISIDPAQVVTNIVIFGVADLGSPASVISNAFLDRGILANPINPTHIRMVTHCDVTRAQCETAVQALAEIVNTPKASCYRSTRVQTARKPNVKNKTSLFQKRNAVTRHIKASCERGSRKRSNILIFADLRGGTPRAAAKCGHFAPALVLPRKNFLFSRSIAQPKPLLLGLVGTSYGCLVLVTLFDRKNWQSFERCAPMRGRPRKDFGSGSSHDTPPDRRAKCWPHSKSRRNPCQPIAPPQLQ